MDTLMSALNFLGEIAVAVTTIGFGVYFGFKLYELSCKASRKD